MFHRFSCFKITILLLPLLLIAFNWMFVHKHTHTLTLQEPDQNARRFICNILSLPRAPFKWYTFEMMVSFSVSFHFLFGFFPLFSDFLVLCVSQWSCNPNRCCLHGSVFFSLLLIWQIKPYGTGVKYCIKRFLIPPFWLHFFFFRSILIHTLLLLFHLTESFYQFITAFGSCILCLQTGYIENLPYFRVCFRTSIESINKI